MKVGVIGLGNMGMGAALNLLHKGHDVTGCELREEIRAAFAAEGGKAVVSADALPPDLEAVVVFVINAAQTEQVLFGEKGCLAGTQTGAVILCCATVAPEAAKALGRRIEDAGFLMIDSPGLRWIGGCPGRNHDRHGFRFRGRLRQGRSRIGSHLNQNLAPRG